MKSMLISSLILICCLLSAQDVDYVKSYLLSYPQTAWEAVKAPLAWDTGEWLAAAGFAALGTGLYLVDEDIASWAAERGGGKGWEVASLPGSNYVVLPALGATVLAGWCCDSPRTMDTGLLCLKSVLLADAAVYGLKYATQRERPSEDRGNEFFNGEGFDRDRDSFPSGHSAVAWALAPVLAEQYGDQGWIAPLAYGAASMVSLSRVFLEKHWASDVLAGSLIGYCSARLTLAGTPRLALMPDPLSGGVAFSLKF